MTHAADAAVARAVAEANAADDEAAVLNQGAENNLPAARPATTPLRCRPDDEASVPGFFMVMSESILLYASPSLVSLSITTYSKVCTFMYA